MKFLTSLLVFFFSQLAYSNTSFEIPRSTVIEITEPSTGHIYPLFIKLPRSYKKTPDQRYPVIYLTDGAYSFQLASGATRYPMNTGVIKEAIIVAISYAKGSIGATSRIRDYTPSQAEGWKSATGNAAGHARFIREQVFPYIDNTYRTDITQRTYAGNSLGGLFGAYLLFKKPEMFDNYIIGSPSVWYDEDHILRTKLKASEKPIKVYLSVGSYETTEHETKTQGTHHDMVAGAKALYTKLNKETGNNVQIKFTVIEGAIHATAFPTTLVQGLHWILIR